MNFTVFKSSAGSGKTFTLVKEYLKIALLSDKPDNYRGILAITFTNKATSEMKERIISALKVLSSVEKLSVPDLSLKEVLISELKISDDVLISRARKTLTHILHHYSDFSISTIDKFVYRIVRAFARDLRIPMNFEVELDAENLLRTAIDKLISKAGTDPFITKILIDFSEKKTEDEKSWKIENDLFEFSEEMLKEESMEFAEKLKTTDLPQFFRIKEDLFMQVQIFEDDVMKMGKEALLAIQNAGVPSDAFAGGKNGIAKYFFYLSECRTDKLYPSPSIRKNVSEDKWHASKISEPDRESIDRIKNTLSGYFSKSLTYIEKNSPNYFLLRLILQNIYSIAVLRELDLILGEIKTEKNIIHISEFNKKIATIVTMESAPFIYERLGERFRHFLLDEFQDTSSLQWLNLLPLIHNALSEGNFNMLVGDGKQAIYRWRSGDVEQFSRLPEIINPSKNKLLRERQLALERNFSSEVLKQNFRSKRELVEFNNYFFRELALKLDENYRSIYQSLEQEFKTENSGGFAGVEILREESVQDIGHRNLERTLEIIQESIKDGFQQKDICILCRKNSDASEIASYLLENKVNVISSESLLLSQSSEINFLISFLNFLCNPSDKKFHAEIAIFLVEKKIVPEELHPILSSLVREEKMSSIIPFLKKSGFEINFPRLQSLPLYELTETLIRIFSLNRPPVPYISFFLDLVHSFSSGDTNNIFDFLEFWEKKKATASMIIPEGLNAVRIMTIHKAKGLEFPVVIFPFANWQVNLTKDFFWVDVLQEVPGLPVAIIEVKKELEQTIFSERYTEEKNKSLLDNFNLLYVAFTRAKNRLHVISSIEKMKNLSKHFIDILQKHQGWDEESFSLCIGTTGNYSGPGKDKEPSLPGENPQQELKQLISSGWREKVRISSNAEKFDGYQEQKNYGKLVHYALSLIKSINDVEPAMEKLFVSGICSQQEKNEITGKIKNLLLNPQVKPFFETGLNIKSETEILLAKGGTYRPDRVILFDERTVIIDYKTGVPLNKHADQLEKYAVAIGEMGYKKIEKYLIYTGEEKVVKI